ncbi:response regulator transcription factor [Aquabacterium sp. A7-Y]|uniref:response regulator n=1 Tax=Aquabacterium sp. A7-Y TaxID=1349605 RepID=UPI00223E5EA3|nr:response regulator transcription factor [Aquabacterium sp. A7-Y]MCW7540593.1 response regulator transcription factor [Aquabacterium sp. A7-Y]
METKPSLKPRLLVVDDERDMVALLQDLLTRAGFEVDGVDSGAAMREALTKRHYHLVLLDLRLRAEDGLTVARQLRQYSEVPLIMISGSSDETDRVLLLELAADDFLVKPIPARELVARVRAVLRRYGDVTAPVPEPAAPDTPRGDRLRFGAWVLDMGARELRARSGALCELTPGEFRLLEVFVRHPHRVWTRDQLLEQTRSLETEVFDRTVDVLILRLRRKIEPNPRHPQFICTERGLGYVFAADVVRL